MEIEMKSYEKLTVDKFAYCVGMVGNNRYRHSDEPEKPDTVIMHPELAREFYIECSKLNISPLDEKYFDEEYFDEDDFKYRQVYFHVMGCKITLYQSMDIGKRKFVIK
jgi:hypothetical protein